MDLVSDARPRIRSVSRALAGERARLRTEVLQLGGALGWRPQEVISFAEALTNCPWRRCGPSEFETVLAEYRALVRAIDEKAERRAVRDTALRAASVKERDSANCR